MSKFVVVIGKTASGGYAAMVADAHQSQFALEEMARKGYIAVAVCPAQEHWSVVIERSRSNVAETAPEEVA